MSEYFNDLADLDDVGTLELADMEVGWNPFKRGGRTSRGRGGRAPMPRGTLAQPRSVNARTLIPRVPGVPSTGVRLQPLGLGATAFTATSGTILQLQASPQRPFKGQRLILDITRTGASATGLVTVTRFDVGTDNQLVGSGAISAAAFAATAFDANIAVAPATPGVSITLQLAISAAPTMTDRVDIGGTLFGTTVG